MVATRATPEPTTAHGANSCCSTLLALVCVDNVCHNTHYSSVATRLRDEIKQSKPFQSLEQEALLSIERTAAVLGHAVADALKQYGVTPTQYNVLRILRGAGKAGLCRNEVRERMIAQVPDVTRLLDRLAELGFIDRERSSGDRRLVTTRITTEGLRLLRQLDQPIADIHKQQLGHMSEQRLHTLIELLSVAREKS